MFTREELEALRDRLEDDEYQKLLNVINAAVERDKLAMDLTETVQKIVQNPTARKKFNELKQVAGIPLDLPKTPIDPIYEKIDELEKKTYAQQMQEKIIEKLNEYGMSREELSAIAKFQQEHKIQDDLAAIELYAMWKARNEELEPVKFHNPLKRNPDEYTIDDAYKLAMNDLRKINIRR